MAKPVILAVDDEPAVLNAVERDLRQHFQGHYRIVKVGSGKQALETARQLKQRSAPIALFLVDERMPEMTGTEFLVEARKLYPDARKVLLTGYADTETAIACINLVDLDHYLLKPWDPPSERLFPILDDLLDDWTAHFRPPYEGIRVAGTLWSPTSHGVKDFLSRSQTPYQWIDVEVDRASRELVETLSPGMRKLPVVFFPDGSALVQPSNQELAQKIGMQTKAKQPFYDLIVIGGGPSGLAAAVYGASEGLRTILIEKDATGGQAGTSSQIENYLGFPSGVSGADLARRATAQARRFGAEVLAPQEATGIKAADPYRTVTLADGIELNCYAMVIAAGMGVRRLVVPGIDAVTGAGVYYGAALTEAASYRDRDVFIVGGANSAGQGAMLFSRYARSVTMLVRGRSLDDAMSQYLIDRISATKNIQVLTQIEVKAVKGDDRLEAIEIGNLENGAVEELPAAAMFIFIGATPRSELAAELVERDEAGFILTGPDLIREGKRPKGWKLARDPFLFETSVPGIFAVGDVRHGSGKRVASAVGEGSGTVSMIHKYLETV